MLCVLCRGVICTRNHVAQLASASGIHADGIYDLRNVLLNHIHNKAHYRRDVRYLFYNVPYNVCGSKERFSSHKSHLHEFQMQRWKWLMDDGGQLGDIVTCAYYTPTYHTHTHSITHSIAEQIRHTPKSSCQHSWRNTNCYLPTAAR